MKYKLQHNLNCDLRRTRMTDVAFSKKKLMHIVL